MSKLRRVREIDWANLPNTYNRAGLIPFTCQNGIIFFAFGIENNGADIADFGGHQENCDQDLLDTAIRECAEESLGVFGPITRQMLQEAYVLEGFNTLEILYYVPPSIYQYTKRFHKLVNLLESPENHEVQNLIWFSRQQLLTVINRQKLKFGSTKIFQMFSRLLITLQDHQHLL